MTQTADSWHVSGAPMYEFTRSTAARRVGALAARSDLVMAHFEYRVPIALPSWWCPEGRPDLGEPPRWVGGALPETKYLGFRHDRLLGSFHPSHRAKWTAHELCHGLVGFAWRPGASRLFHATAARIAEVLPVALWYFFDEADAQRCPVHAGQGPRRGETCWDCEAAGEQGPRDIGDGERWWAEGRAWLADELASIDASIRLGRPVAHPHGAVDLASDGLAYAAAQTPRLSDPDFERYVSLFFGERQGCFHDLADLQARVTEVMGAICGDGEAEPLAGDRWRWIGQDLGMRLMTILVETDGEVSTELDRLLVRLAEAPSADTIEGVIDDYRSLHAEWVLPEPADVFAVGYPLPGGMGLSAQQAGLGLQSACPRTWEALGDRADDVVSGFLDSEGPERWVRQPIGRRFAGFMAGEQPGPLADLARFEAAITHARAPDLITTTLGSEAAADTTVRFNPRAEIVQVNHDVTDVALAPQDEAQSWLVWRAVDGDARLLAVSHTAAQALLATRGEPVDLETLRLDPEEASQLVDYGVLVPVRWALDVLPDERV